MKTDENVNEGFNEDTSRTAAASQSDGRGTDSGGFSLIELLLVSAVLSVLAALAIPSYTQMLNTARVARAKEEIRGLEKDISAYVADTGRLPPSLVEIGRNGAVDPWKGLYVYSPVPAYTGLGGEILNTDYDLYSKGDDMASTADLLDDICADDVFRAGDGAALSLGRQF